MANASSIPQDGTVYLLHFDKRISDRHTTQHSIGWALNAEARLREHQRGHGARLTQVAVERDISFEIARTWPGDRSFERRLKQQKNGPRLCPVCNARQGDS